MKLTKENMHEYPCPDCEADDFALHIESSRELGVSKITCRDCVDYTFQDECCEEDLIDKFNAQTNNKE